MQASVHRSLEMKQFGKETVEVDMDDLEMQLDADADASSPSYSDLEGDLTAASANRQTDTLDTLDEPVWDTLKRDLRAVGFKFGHVLYPAKDQTLLRDWDLWGPLFLCVFISLLLQDSSTTQKGPQFTQLFVITFFGACVVTLNIKLLGGHISFFQSICVLGYCLLPSATAALLCKVIVMAANPSSLVFALRLGITCCGFAWSTYASTAFLSGSQPARRKALAVYPIFLFYFVVSWLIISHTHYGH